MVKDNREGMDKVRGVLAYWKRNAVRIGMLSNPDPGSPGGNSTDPAKTDKGMNAPITVGEVFVIHELGLGNMPSDPPRSALAATMDNDSPQIERLMADVADAALQGKITGEQSLAFLGEETIELIKQRIRNHIPPPLTEERKRQKVRAGKPGDTPLVNFGQLINSFRYAIRED